MADATDEGAPTTSSILTNLETFAQSTEMQFRTRKARRFSEVEADLQIVTQHASHKLSSAQAVKDAAKSTLTDLLSYLGPNNPKPEPITANDTVWLMDNTAYLTAPGSASASASAYESAEWQAEFIACVFAQHSTGKTIGAVQQIANKIGMAGDDQAIATIEKRLQPFVMDIQPGKEVHALCGEERARLKLGPAGRNGISSDKRPVPATPRDGLVHTEADVPQGAKGMLRMKTFFAGPEGWAVISDIDDTIKITQTSDPIGILTSTFVSEPTPIKGMPEFYSYILSKIGPLAPFFYLSASPYNLYPFLHGFREQHYPHGQLVLRDASWMSVSGLLSNLTLGTHEYKVDRMQKIHGWLPGRKLICIGDSTQSDPEAYGDTYRAFPGWVKVILIRKVTDIAALGIEDKNKPERFEKAFEGIPTSVWHVFEDPAECYQFIQKAVSSSSD